MEASVGSLWLRETHRDLEAEDHVVWTAEGVALSDSSECQGLAHNDYLEVVLKVGHCTVKVLEGLVVSEEVE